MTMGKDSITNGRTNQERVHWAEGTAIQKDDYFVLTAGTASDGSAKSYLLQYRNSDKSTKTSPKITFKNMGSGEDLEYSVSTSGTVATIKLGGYSFQLTNDSSMGSDDFNLNVSLDGDTDYTDTANPVNFIDSYGSQWAVNVDGGADSGNANQTNLTGINFTMTTPNTDDYDNFVPSTLIYTITADSTPEVRAGLLMDSADNFITPDGETEVKYGWTSMGAFITFSEPSSDPDEILMEYPSEQRLPLVYVTSGATTSSTVSGDLTSVKVVDATKLDSEVASVSAQNLITVGGPCVNTVSAELLGNPADCTEGFTPGVARVKLFEEGTSVAMLVAGYSGEDTRLAGKVVANRWTELSGSEVEIEGTTYSDATISAPSAAPAADDTEETTE